MKKIYLIVFAFTLVFNSFGQHSVAREWNELNLNSVRNDFAKPTHTARNLWHTSAAMYDAWAAFDLEAETYFLGKNVGGFYTPFNGVFIPETPELVEEARNEAISYAAYRVLCYRYSEGFVPEGNEIIIKATYDNYMLELGYDINFTSTDFSEGNPAALGNYIGEQIIAFGNQDGSNELGNFQNQYYEPTNVGFLIAGLPGNPSIADPNRWQRLLQTLDQNQQFIDSDFLSPEWGNVIPFSLEEEDKTIYGTDAEPYNVYCDPGAPPYISDSPLVLGMDDDYKKGFLMVAAWSSLLDPENETLIDISPNNIGNITSYPESIEEYDDFYGFTSGLDTSQGYEVNPSTSMPYDEQWVPLGDYGRVLAEFWADGPDSETPPGHWFSILNYVSDHPELVKQWNGQGDLVNDLEWDVKTYFALGAAMHDCAVSAWSVKGWYDYVRPISAIRYMADRGQSTDSSLPSYNPEGLPLLEGYSELVETGDPLAGDFGEHVGKIKIFAWRGPDYLDQIDLETEELLDPVQDSTVAGVDWILAENWWPYQRPSFITPPFAGYISGHSTFSRGAAQILALMTGDEYFPGGMGVFPCPQNDFLVFEEGPSQYLELQWAKYIDASDQCSLSRIYGGIHPPADDIPGRIIGQKIGLDVFDKVNNLIFNEEPRVIANTINVEVINDEFAGEELIIEVTYNRPMDQNSTPVLSFTQDVTMTLALTNAEWLDDQTFSWTYNTQDADLTMLDIGFSVDQAQDLNQQAQALYTVQERFDIDTESPILIGANNPELLNSAATSGTAQIFFTFSEPMTPEVPSVTFTNNDPTINSLTPVLGEWIADDVFAITYSFTDVDEELEDIFVLLEGLTDANGNDMISTNFESNISIDTKEPEVVNVLPETAVLNISGAQAGTWNIQVQYDDDMSPEYEPNIQFPTEQVGTDLVLDMENSSWINSNTFEFVFNVIDNDLELEDIDVAISGGKDDAENDANSLESEDLFSVDLKAPQAIVSFLSSDDTITDEDSEGTLTIDVEFDEEMSSEIPEVSFDQESFSLTLSNSEWVSDSVLTLTFDIADGNEELNINSLSLSGVSDLAGNLVEIPTELMLEIDNENPCAIVAASTYDITASNTGVAGFQILAIFESEVNQELQPTIEFPEEDPSTSISLNVENSGWLGSTYVFSYDVNNELIPMADIDIQFVGVEDSNGNEMCEPFRADLFSVLLDTVLTVYEPEAVKTFIVPNPVKAGQEVQLLTQMEVKEVLLYNTLGAEVRVDFEQGSDAVTLKTKNLAAGTYIIRVSDGNLTEALHLLIKD